jgi:hypothetical protein
MRRKRRAGQGRNHLRLLPEEPAQGLGTAGAVGGQEVGAVGEVQQDRVRLGQRVRPVLLEDWCLAQGIEPAELLRERVTGEDVDRDALVLAIELGEQEADLVAVAGGRVVVQAQCHVSFNA